MTDTSDTATAPKRRPGRPRKSEKPRIPYEELDKLLVHGETVPCADGTSTTIHFPTYRDLAKRYGCAHSLVSAYAKRHNCLRRREEAKLRVAAQADAKLVEMRAGAVALGKDDAIRIIDSYVVEFEKSLAQGKVRTDNPGDFNTLLRLKELLVGGADSRQEVHGVLSLETIQDRHQRMLRAAHATAEERGEVRALASADDGDHSGDDSEDHGDGEGLRTSDYIAAGDNAIAQTGD